MAVVRKPDFLSRPPTWGMLYWILFVVVGGIVAAAVVLVDFGGQIGQIEDRQNQAEERGYINRAMTCLILIVDNDRFFELPDECLHPRVAAYYPREVCTVLEGIGSSAPDCGEKA